MNTFYSSFYFALMVCILALTAGCGGVSHSGIPSAMTGGSTAHAQGQITLTIKWPAVPVTPHGLKPLLVPEAAQSITVSLSAGGQSVGAPQVVARPTGQTTSAATFNTVPPGSVTVEAKAYPSADGTGIALATGSVVVSVTTGGTTAASVTMASTIDHLSITPDSPSIAVGATTPLSATAYDVASDMVLTTASKVQWSSSDPTIVTVDPNSGMVTGVAVGSATLTVTDSESGKTGITTITITASGGGTAAYTITDLGQFRAAAVNDNGQVAGFEYTGKPIVYQVVLYQNGGITHIAPFQGQIFAIPSGINISGQMVGGQPFLYSNGQAVDFNSLMPGNLKVFTLGTINDIGQVTGGEVGTTSPGDAFLWQNGNVTDLGRLPGDGFSEGLAVNNLGQVVGTSQSQSNGGLPDFWLWQNGQIRQIQVPAASTFSNATAAINNRGHAVVSFYVSPTSQHSYLDDAGQITDLGNLRNFQSTRAQSINDADQIVGVAVPPDVTRQQLVAFLWQNGQIIDLNTQIPSNSGWSLWEATGVNNNGQICGSGFINGQTHAFLLTPVAATAHKRR